MPQSQALCQQLATKIQRYSMRWLNVCKVSCLLIKAISRKTLRFTFEEGIQLVTGLRVNMKNKLMPFYDKMMLRKRYIIETINDLLKNTAQIVHSRHWSVANFIINIISVLRGILFLWQQAQGTYWIRYRRYETAESFLTLHILHEDFVSATIQDI